MSVIPNFKHILHGGDYNPDQWLHITGTVDHDFELMKKASCNAFSVGIFSWGQLEVRQDVFEFGWLDDIFERAQKAGIKLFLATPSAAKPGWMAEQHPETGLVAFRTAGAGREPWSGRQNSCLSNAYFRERVRIIDEKLSQRYGHHPALGGWHISNEYSTACVCADCTAKYREYLRKKYKTLDNLNKCYWSAFWSHTYTGWDQIQPGDNAVNIAVIDWKRFVTEQHREFFKMEIDAVRKYSELPVTTNMMGLYGYLDYWRIAAECDFIADDCYPTWYPGITEKVAANFSALHDMHYAMLDKPFLMMESCPGIPQYKPYVRIRRPNEFQREMLMALGHGADGTMYFQWRRGRGNAEQYHGAVVGHDGSDKTIQFRNVADYGAHLDNIAETVDSRRHADAAVILDWDALWCFRQSSGFEDEKVRKQDETIFTHYQALWRKNFEMDVIEETRDFSKYKLIAAPMTFLLKDGVRERIEEFIKNGGTFVLTYLSAYTDQNNQCFDGGFPGGFPLRKVFGVWNEDIDGLTPEVRQSVRWNGNSYAVQDYAEILHAEGADVLASYESEFYAGSPAVTLNHYGKGRAVYIGARTGLDFLIPFYESLARSAGCRPVLDGAPDPLRISRRVGADGSQYFYVLNMTDVEQRWTLPEPMTDLWNGTASVKELVLPSAGSTVLKLKK